MAEEGRPKAEGDRLVTPELAATELADSGDDRTRTGPRVLSPRRGSPRARAVGRFRIDAQLGSGGMGDVFRAYDTVLDRAVALKVLHTDRAADDGQRMRRVVREARAAAALVHPNAVTVFDVGEADNEVFIAMELLEGEDLRAALERGEATLKDKLRWLLEAARALAAAHERGLVHRDVKPENMFVCKGGTLKLLDFGIAKRDDDEALQPDAAALSVGPSSLRTIEGRRVGTPRYMAPEQHAGESTDARTDEFAWGLVAFELLTGTHIATDLRTMTRDGGAGPSAELSGTERLEMLRARAPEVADEVARAIARALEPAKEDRFPSMASVVAALENAPPPSSSPRLDVPASVRMEAPVGAAITAPASEPARSPARRSLWKLVVLALLVVTAVGVARARSRRARATMAAASAASAGALTSAACRVASARTLALATDDLLTVLPTGAILIARNVPGGIALEREEPDGELVPFLRAQTSIMGRSYDRVALRGVTYRGEPAVFGELFQGARGTALTLLSERNGMSMRRVFGNVVGTSVAPLGAELVVAAAVRGPDDRPGFSGIQALALGTVSPSLITIDEGNAGDPAIATQGDRVALAYTLWGGVSFALLGADLHRLGDAVKVDSVNAAPAVAFAGSAPIVFWTDGRGGKTRLTSASLTPGAAAFSTPKPALDEPLAPQKPVTARLPDGTWAVAWVAFTGGLATLRASPIRADATLVAPSELAKSAAFGRLQAASTDLGIAYWWYEDEKTVRVVRTSCAQP